MRRVSNKPKRNLVSVGPEGIPAYRVSNRKYVAVLWVRPTAEAWTLEIKKSIAHQEAAIRLYLRDIEENGVLSSRHGVECLEQRISDLQTSIRKLREDYNRGYVETPWADESWHLNKDVAIGLKHTFTNMGWLAEVRDARILSDPGSGIDGVLSDLALYD